MDEQSHGKAVELAVRRGAAWLCMVRRGSVWCGVAQFMVRRGSVWCGVAQLVARRLAVRPEFDSRLGTTGSCFPTEQTSDEEMERGKWRWINVLYECD